MILTGDSKRAGEAAARAVGADEVYSELLPEDKVSRVEEIMAQMNGGSLVFLGDGINDAPVIARADVGAAMGGLGADAAVESADVVIMDDKPEKLAAGIRIARRTMRILRSNVAFALGFKLLVLLLCGIGLGPMWLAVFGDVGVTLLCILNAASCLRMTRVYLSAAVSDIIKCISNNRIKLKAPWLRRGLSKRVSIEDGLGG